MTELKKPRKLQLQDLLTQGQNVIQQLYARLASHMPSEITEQDVFDLLVRDDDKDACIRAKTLFDYNGGSYEPITIRHYAPDTHLYVWCRELKSFVLPSYLAGSRLNRADVNPLFLEKVDPWGMQLAEFHTAHRMAISAWSRLRILTQDNVSKMLALWPSVAVIGKQHGLPLDLLPKAKSLPSPHPDLREEMRRGADFINTAMLMGDAESRPKPAVQLWLHS